MGYRYCPISHSRLLRVDDVCVRGNKFSLVLSTLRFAVISTLCVGSTLMTIPIPIIGVCVVLDSFFIDTDRTSNICVRATTGFKPLDYLNGVCAYLALPVKPSSLNLNNPIKVIVVKCQNFFLCHSFSLS